MLIGGNIHKHAPPPGRKLSRLALLRTYVAGPQTQYTEWSKLTDLLSRRNNIHEKKDMEMRSAAACL